MLPILRMSRRVLLLSVLVRLSSPLLCEMSRPILRSVRREFCHFRVGGTSLLGASLRVLRLAFAVLWRRMGVLRPLSFAF